MMPRTDVLLSAGEQATRADIEGMAAEMKQRHVLKCFERSNAMTVMPRIIEIALGMARGRSCGQAVHGNRLHF
jgi:hypothetical protein